jgi:hypothetical protein
MHYTQKAQELKTQFGDNAKYVVSEIVDAIKMTTGHLTIVKSLERQELQDDFNFWLNVKKALNPKNISQNEKPKVICLCGSTRFFKEFEKQNLQLTLEGVIVLSIGSNTKSDESLNLPEGTKEMLDELHKRKIDIADDILVLNVGGYIGESTRSEIKYALDRGKPVNYLEKFKI